MMVEYSQGYGRREPLPVCDPIKETAECPCCQGAGEHSFGAGMDADSVDCSPCGGWGYFFLTKLARKSECPKGILYR